MISLGLSFQMRKLKISVYSCGTTLGMTVKWWSASYNQSPKCCGINSELNNRYFDYFYSNFDIFCWSKTKSNIYDLSGTAVNNYSVFKIHDDDDGLFATHGVCVNRKIAEFCKITKGTAPCCVMMFSFHNKYENAYEYEVTNMNFYSWIHPLSNCYIECFSLQCTCPVTNAKMKSSKFMEVNNWWFTGGRLNKKDGLTRYGDSHVKDKTS